MLLALANIGTAVTLFPNVRRQSEGLALGYVAGRVVESMIIIVGIISMVTLVRMRQDVAGAAGASAISLVVAGKTLIASRFLHRRDSCGERPQGFFLYSTLS